MPGHFSFGFFAPVSRYKKVNESMGSPWARFPFAALVRMF
jgi:hypothetical protein